MGRLRFTLYVYVRHVLVQCSQRPVGGTVCEPPCGCWDLGPLQKQQYVLLTTEPTCSILDNLFRREQGPDPWKATFLGLSVLQEAC